MGLTPRSNTCVSPRSPGPVAWVSLDQGDADRHRFWRLVATALGVDVAVPRCGDLSATLDALCLALARREEPVVLVLDDLHEVDDGEAAADLNRLLAGGMCCSCRTGRSARQAGGSCWTRCYATSSPTKGTLRCPRDDLEFLSANAREAAAAEEAENIGTGRLT